MKKQPSQDRLKELLTYDEGLGVFRWNKFMGGSARKYSIAGNTDGKGYTQVRIDGVLHLAHRLVWLYVHGAFPDGDLDHIDRNPKNNRLNNLRICTHAQNHQNTGVRVDSTSGVTGVSWVSASKKWLAYITIEGKTKRLGLFENKSDAVAARKAAKKQFHVFVSQE